MEVARQVQLLLRRNVALRVRQPVILALELLWPVLIFLVVMAARNSIPPVSQPTCHYNAWALPSAGVVPFVQSMICNIDNCLNYSDYEKIPTYPGSSVEELVDHLVPLISDTGINDLVEALPKGMRLMRVAVDALSGPDLSTLIGSGFPVRHLLKNTDHTKELLLQKNFTTKEIEQFLNSSIELPHLLDMINGDVFCDTKNVSSTDAFSKIRVFFCQMDDSSRKQFLHNFKNQLDIKSVVQTLGLAMSELGRLDIGKILENIGGLLANIQSSDSVASYHLSILTTFLDNIRFNQIDTKMISYLVQDLEPLYKNSEWAGLISILKSKELFVFPEKKLPYVNSTYASLMNSSIAQPEIELEKDTLEHHNTTSLIEVALDLLQTSMDILQVLPQSNFANIKKVIPLFRLIFEIANDLSHDLGTGDASSLVNKFGDILGAVFLNAAKVNEMGAKNLSSENLSKVFCNSRNFAENFQMPIDMFRKPLQEYACRISTVAQKIQKNYTHEGDWELPVHYLRQLANQKAEFSDRLTWNDTFYRKLIKVQKNWTSVDVDLVQHLAVSAACLDFKVQDFLNHTEKELNSSKGNFNETGNRQVPNLSNHFKNKNVQLVIQAIHEIKTLVHRLGKNNWPTKLQVWQAFPTFLTIVDKVLMGKWNIAPTTFNTLNQMISSFTSQLQNQNSSDSDIGMTQIFKAVVNDIELAIWETITPSDIGRFIRKRSSSNFCIATNFTRENHIYLGPFLCSIKPALTVITLPKANKIKQKNIYSKAWNVSTKDVEKFFLLNNSVFIVRMLSKLMTDFEHASKSGLKVLTPVNGCNSSCDTTDIDLLKMCFLGRMQNVKKSLYGIQTSQERLWNVEDSMLQILKPFLGLNEEVIEAYNLLLDAAQFSTEKNSVDTKDVIRLVLGAVRLLESFDGNVHRIRPFLHVMNSLVSLLKNRIADASRNNDTSIVRIEDVFVDSPLTQTVVKSLLPILPDIISTFFWTALTPGKFQSLVQDSDKNITKIMGQVCNSSLTDFLYNPGLPLSGFETIGKVVCSHRYFDVFEEIFEDPDIQNIIFEVSNTEDEIEWDDMHKNIIEIINLVANLTTLKKIDLNVLPSTTEWNGMVTTLKENANKPPVILYVLNNQLFHGFCDVSNSKLPTRLRSLISTNQDVLFDTLCSISKEQFADKLVKRLNETFFQSFSKQKSSNVFNFRSLMYDVFISLASVPELNQLGKTVLGFDFLTVREEADGRSFIYSKEFFMRMANTTQNMFEIIDALTSGQLSSSVLGSSVPEVVNDFVSFVKNSGPHIDLNAIFTNDNKAQEFIKCFFQPNGSRKRADAYIKTLAKYFGKRKNLEVFLNLCKTYKPQNNSRTIHGLCRQNPSVWSLATLERYEESPTSTWNTLQSFLPIAIRNETHDLFLSKRKREFFAALNQALTSLSHFENWNVIKTTRFKFSFLKAFAKVVADNLESEFPNLKETLCITEPTEAFILQSSQRLVKSIPNVEFLTCRLFEKNISSLYIWFSETSHFKEVIEKVANDMHTERKCIKPKEWMPKLVDILEQLHENMIATLDNEMLHRVVICLKNSSHSPLAKSLQLYGYVLKNIARYFSKPAPIAHQWKNSKEKIIFSVAQHFPVFYKIADVIPKESSIISSFVSPTRNKPHNALKSALLNFNWISRHNFSSSALSKAICDGEKLSSSQNALTFPPDVDIESQESVKTYICAQNRSRQLLKLIDRKSIESQIKEAQQQAFFSGHWLKQFINSWPVLVDVGSHLSEALKNINISNMYDLLQLFTRPQAFSDISYSLQKLINILDPIFSGSSLLDTLQQVLDGLGAFKSFAQLTQFNFNYTVSEIFGDKAKSVLQERFKIDSKSISAVMNAQVDLKQVSVNKSSGKVSFCKDNERDNLLCILSSYEETTLSLDHLQDLMLQRILLSFGQLGVEGLLHSAKVKPDEAEKTFKALSTAPAVVSRLTKHLESITSALDPSIKELFQNLDKGTQWLGTTEALTLGGTILCGRPLTSLSQKFMLLSPEETSNKIEEAELLRLPSEFCRHGYRELMKMRGGAILWGLLKPLFRGKILYSSASYPSAQAIITKMNETLMDLGKQIQFMRAAAEGTTGLHYIELKKDSLDSLQKVLESKSVARLVGSQPWFGALSELNISSTPIGRSLLNLVELIGNVTQCISLDRFIGFETEAELEAAAATLHERREFIAAIVFPNAPNENSQMLIQRNDNKIFKLPKNIMYKIRMDIDNVPTSGEIKYRWWRPYPYDDFFEDHRYFRGFLQLQDTIDSIIIDLQTDSKYPQVKKYLQQFPYPCHQRDKFGTLLKGSMPAVMTISWIFIVTFLVREKVLDRELGLDETLRIMGLKPSSAWLAWFCSGACVLLVSVVGIVVVLKWGGLTPSSNPVILFIFVADFAVLLIAYCQLVSTFFGRATTAALIAILLYVLSFFPFLLFVTWELDFLLWQKILACILVSTSFCFGCLYLNRYEDQGQGIQWSNLWLSPVSDDRMNFGTTLLTMAACSLAYFFISWYASKVWPANKRTNYQPWYFLLSPTYWSSDGSEKQIRIQDNKPKYFSQGSQDATESSASTKKTVGISVKNVCAIYSKRDSNQRQVLKGLDLTLYEGQITSLLGHNGAGKTTTIKILTGRISPSSGVVEIYGIPVSQRMSDARKLIGYCPQNNALYDKLTVREHLYLFAQLKGLLSRADARRDVEKMLKNLNLTEKADVACEYLSGGQQRRLCVGIAFVGGSKVIILDEPTSSVDPVARRSIWDLILEYKKDRTILLTTHHLDEADILSDKVAILHKGQMLCFGSPLYLKSHFGSGYRLSLQPNQERQDKDSDSGRASYWAESDCINVDCDGVMEFIQAYVQGATLLENDESRLVVSLPADPLPVCPLSKFFAELDKRLHSWGFQSYSLSSATLEEVFLILCRLEDAKSAHVNDMVPDKSLIFSSPSEKISNDVISPMAVEIQTKDRTCNNHDLLDGMFLKYVQLKSLLMKRYWHTKKNWKTLTSSVIMPCLFIAIAMGLAVGKPQKDPDPSIELRPSLYSSDVNKAVSIFGWDKKSNTLGANIFRVLNHNVSLQVETCSNLMMTNGWHKQCDLSILESKKRCLCEKECSTSAITQVPFFSTPKHLLYNMTNVDIPPYLLNTYLLYNEKRYGGWTLDHTPDVAAKIWFENSGYHAAPSYLNTMNNAILNSAFPSFQNYSIQTWSHPLRLSVEQLGRETLLQRLGEVGIAVIFLIGLSLVPATFAVYVVGERESEQKRLQMVTGAMGPALYWIAAVLWDLAIVLLTTLLSAIIVKAFALPAFNNRENFRAVYMLVFLYGWATTSLTYLLCRLFREGSLAFMVLFTSHVFVGLIIMLSLVSLRIVSISKDVAAILELLQSFSLVFPQYSFIGGLTYLNENQVRSEIFAQFGQDVYISPFSWTALGSNYVVLFTEGLLFFICTILLEIIPFRSWLERFFWTKKESIESKDSVEKVSCNDLLVVRNVSQVFHSKAGFKVAVSDLTLSIPEGECFGLVGANGAGKTTLFRLLIGEMSPTQGRIFYGIPNDAKHQRCSIGYCPQKDALDGLLTPKEHLLVYAGLRGIGPSNTLAVVTKSLETFKLTDHADCPVQTLSGGTKRKLCTAIATIGDPQIILLDEPTSGMDPGTRRLVWKTIAKATEARQSVILTSHSIEDCDVLCTRLGIMVNGKLTCLDSPNRLKSRLGTGYTVSFRIPETIKDCSPILSFIRNELSSTSIQMKSRRRVEMTQLNEKLTLSQVFKQLERCAASFGIEDLAIDPTTLDQVFVTYIRRQSDAVQPPCHAQLNPAFCNDVEICSTKL